MNADELRAAAKEAKREYIRRWRMKAGSKRYAKIGTFEDWLESQSEGRR